MLTSLHCSGARLRAFCFATLAALTLPAFALGAAPVISGLPTTVLGTQAQVPFSGPTGPTYSSFTVTAPATGVISAASPANPFNVWCGNPYGYIQGVAETYTAYSSYDPAVFALGNEGTQAQWQQINWVLNNKKGQSGALASTVTDIQFVIYDLLIPGYDTASLSTDGTQLLTDAQTYGNGFVPAAGQVLAIVLYNAGINANDGPGSIQDLLLEYAVPAVPQMPGVKITKTASVSVAKCSDKVTYTYIVTNTGTVTLTNISVTDDNATPNYSGDDFTVASNITLAGGASQTFTKTVLLPVTQTDSANNFSHLLVSKILPNGDVQVTFMEDLALVDNSYGQGSSPDWGSNGNNAMTHIGQDSAEFEFVDGAGNTVLDFAADYVSFNNKYPSGVGTAGIDGGAGHLFEGDRTNIVSIDTTITDNLNNPANIGAWTWNSPPPGCKNWKFQCGYTVVVKASCFGWNGFGGCHIKNVQHGKCKTGSGYQCQPKPCAKNVTNTATVTATALVNGTTQTLTANAKATVALTVDQPPTGHCACWCWNCWHGDHAHCLFGAFCHDSNCNHGQPAQCPPPPHWQPCTQANWSKKCNTSFVRCGRNW